MFFFGNVYGDNGIEITILFVGWWIGLVQCAFLWFRVFMATFEVHRLIFPMFASHHFLVFANLIDGIDVIFPSHIVLLKLHMVISCSDI